MATAMNGQNWKRIQALLLLGALFVAGVTAGFWIAKSLNTPNSLANDIKRWAARQYVKVAGRRVQDGLLVTNRVTLKVSTVFLPPDTPEFAGGITDVDGTGVLIIDREGGLHWLEGSKVSAVNLPPPANNADDLRQKLAAGAFGKSTVDWSQMRYMDVLHVRASGNAWLLVSYTEWHPVDYCFTTTLARIEVPSDAAPPAWQFARPGWTVIARTSPCLAPLPYESSTDMLLGIEAGGRLARGVEGKVLWATGSYERDDRVLPRDFATALAQSESSSYGRVLEVDIPSGNVSELAKGLRNPQGITVDAKGSIWVVDHGMRGGDELDLVVENANFGFPVVTYGTRYDGGVAGNGTRHAGHGGYDKPVMAFVPSIAPGCVLAVERFHYAWDGDLLVCAMNRSAIYRVHIEDGRAIYAEPVDIGIRPRDMVQLNDGRLAVWTDNNRILFLTPEGETNTAGGMLEARVAALVPEGERGEVLNGLNGCLQCHSLAAGEQATGPSLHGICGRKPASTEYRAYSAALTELSGRWTKERLAAFIVDPQNFAPGTTMSARATGDSAVVRSMVAVLCGPETPPK
jgi:cytochrome c2